MELIYYVDSAGLNESNSMLAKMGCEECEKKCSNGMTRNLWRLPNRESLDDFFTRTKPEQWYARIFWARTREEKPKQIAAEDIAMNEEKLKVHRNHRHGTKHLRAEAAALLGS